MFNLRGFYKFYILLLVCFAVGSTNDLSYSQDEPLELEGFVVGGGTFVQGLLLDLEPLETLISTEFDSDIEFADQPLFMTIGGGGFAGRDLRIGMFGITGAWSGEVAAPAFDTATLNLNYDGLYLEQNLFQESSLQFSIGALIGAGVWKIELLSGNAITFEDSLKQPIAVLLEREFLLLQPYVSSEYHWGGMGLQLQAGVLGTFSLSPWFLPGRVELEGGPMSINLIPTITLSLIFGV